MHLNSYLVDAESETFGRCEGRRKWQVRRKRFDERSPSTERARSVGCRYGRVEWMQEVRLEAVQQMGAVATH